MPPVGIEPALLVSELPQTHALDRTAIGIGYKLTSLYIYIYIYIYMTGEKIGT
jgi:hypothetical protein